ALPASLRDRAHPHHRHHGGGRQRQPAQPERGERGLSVGPASPRPMDRTVTIAILTHALQELRPGTTIARIANEHWQPEGHRTVVHRGLDRLPPADVAIQHVDLTKVPRPYLALDRVYPRVINGAVADISKRAISSDLLSEGDDHRGPVMVKTDLN